MDLCHVPLYVQSYLCFVLQVLELADSYEEAVIALPLAVKERLLRILRLRIATRFDVSSNTVTKGRCLNMQQIPQTLKFVDYKFYVIVKVATCLDFISISLLIIDECMKLGISLLVSN